MTSIIVFLCYFVVLFAATIILNYIKKRKARDMTYDKLVKKAKELIDKGQYDNLKSHILSHPRLLFKHYEELMATLSDYAREKDSVSDNIKFKEV